MTPRLTGRPNERRAGGEKPVASVAIAAAHSDLDRGNLAAASGAMTALIGRLSEWQVLYDMNANGASSQSAADLRAFARGEPVVF